MAKGKTATVNNYRGLGRVGTVQRWMIEHESMKADRHKKQPNPTLVKDLICDYGNGGAYNQISSTPENASPE